MRTKKNFYSEKLKHPKWQKKRLEIFLRDNWKCVTCGSREKTLHLHHLVYEKGIEPWEAKSEHLRTLCCDCHAEVHGKKKKKPKKLPILKKLLRKKKYKMWKHYTEKPKKTTAKKNCR